jgi:hypothetical protein
VPGRSTRSLGISLDTLPKIDDIEEFFGAEAKVGVPSAPWQESSLTIETELAGDRVWLEIIPRARHAQFRWSGTPFRVFDLHLNDVATISIIDDEGKQYLSFTFEDPTSHAFKLFLRPHLLCFWGNGHPGRADA